MGGPRLPQPRSSRKEGAKSNGKESRMCPLNIPAGLTKRSCVGCSEQSRSHWAVDGEVTAGSAEEPAGVGRVFHQIFFSVSLFFQIGSVLQLCSQEGS